MSDSVGLGFLANVVFWTVAVLVATGLASLAVIEYFPGRERKAEGKPRASAGGRGGEDRRREKVEEPERYRKAS